MRTLFLLLCTACGSTLDIPSVDAQTIDSPQDAIDAALDAGSIDSGSADSGSDANACSQTNKPCDVDASGEYLCTGNDTFLHCAGGTWIARTCMMSPNPCEMGKCTKAPQCTQ